MDNDARKVQEMRKHHLETLVKSEGWKIVVDHIDTDIANAMNRLVISAAEDIVEYQKTIKILRQLKKYIYDGAGLSQ